MSQTDVQCHDLGAVTIYQGHVLDCLRQIPDGAIQCVVTSPPYWGLRSYMPDDHPLKPLEIGAEATPDEYVANLVTVFREVRRVLRPDGVCWVNLGETYAGDRGGSPHGAETLALRYDESGLRGRSATSVPSRNARLYGLKHKDACNIPHRFAAAMQTDGWWWRDTVIWHKPSPMPLSITGWRWERHRIKVEPSPRALQRYGKYGCTDANLAQKGGAGWVECPGCEKCNPNGGLVLRKGSWRTTTAHEYVFMFAKSEHYFCDALAVAEPAASSTIARNRYSRKTDDADAEQYAVKHDHEFVGLTRNPRSVWVIAAKPFYNPTEIRHFAAYPLELAERCIKAGTSEAGCCIACGAPLARVLAPRPFVGSGNTAEYRAAGVNRRTTEARQQLMTGARTPQTVGWKETCNCGVETAPCIVLDPFGGSGTTAIAAVSLGRRAVLCEINPEYVALAKARIMHDIPLLAASGVAETA